jgi:7,8-dihydropterin-6-yl-methyl-4-(beta-D-ribofuranosyl)aminobenzene 5'-phosphate synthase
MIPRAFEPEITKIPPMDKVLRRHSWTATRLNRIAASSAYLVPPLADDYIREAVANLKAINPDYIIPAHCTGETFYEIAKTEMPGKMIRSTVGTRFTFGP